MDEAIARFHADPEMAALNTAADLGGCWFAAHRFAWYCHTAGVPYAIRKWRNLPHLRTDRHHNVQVGDRIVDWTYRQIDPGAAWPHVEGLDGFRARFGDPLPICEVCGASDDRDPQMRPVRHVCRGITRQPRVLIVSELTIPTSRFRVFAPAEAPTR